MRAGLVGAAVKALLTCDLAELEGVAEAWRSSLDAVEWETAISLAGAGASWAAADALARAAEVVHELVRAGDEVEAERLRQWVLSKWSAPSSRWST